MNIKTNGDTGTLLRNSSLKVYVWKLGSTNPTTPNLTLPPAYNPTSQDASRANSIWLHGTSDYNFGTFEDGAQQTNASTTCRTGVVGTTANATFGGNDCTTGILMRVEVVKGVRVDEISVTFI